MRKLGVKSHQKLDDEDRVTLWRTIVLELASAAISQRGSHWIWSPWQLNTNTSQFL